MITAQTIAVLQGLFFPGELCAEVTGHVKEMCVVDAGYHFITYGEVLTCWLQDAMIMFLILKFK